MTARLAHAFWTTAPGQGEIRDIALPDCRDGDVRVRTLYSAISRGTESLVFRGDVPASEHDRMRAPWQDGDFPFPVKYGYINVGRVEQGPDALSGRTVFCLYPHQTEYVVPATAVTPLPGDLPPQRAVLTANMETAVNVVWDAAPLPGDRIAVIGAGTVGCLVAWLAASVAGCRVQLIDTNTARATVAEALGVEFQTPTSAHGDADLVIHTSGNPAGLTTALSLAGYEARIVEASWFGSRDVALPLGGSFHSRRLCLVSSQVGQIAPAQRARWDYPRRLRLALSLLAAEELDVLITNESDFYQLPVILGELATHTPPSDRGDLTATLCHRIRYP